MTKSVTRPTDKPTLPPVTQAQALELIQLIEDGVTIAQAADTVGIHKRTAYRVVCNHDVDVGHVRKFLQLRALESAQNWVLASREAAAKGDHRAAKELLLHAGAIEPIADAGQAGNRIAIIIGTPDQPIRMVNPSSSDTEDV